VLNAKDLSSIEGSVPGKDINKMGSSLLVSVNNLFKLSADGKISGRPIDFINQNLNVVGLDKKGKPKLFCAKIIIMVRSLSGRSAWTKSSFWKELRF
jgi:hypothetical protein